jgi:hypothetical protein
MEETINITPWGGKSSAETDAADGSGFGHGGVGHNWFDYNWFGHNWFWHGGFAYDWVGHGNIFQLWSSFLGPKCDA